MPDGVLLETLQADTTYKLFSLQPGGAAHAGDSIARAAQTQVRRLTYILLLSQTHQYCDHGLGQMYHINNCHVRYGSWSGHV